ncbi:unnamed protein product [Knipowitschia caucasica]
MRHTHDQNRPALTIPGLATSGQQINAFRFNLPTCSLSLLACCRSRRAHGTTAEDAMASGVDVSGAVEL